MEEISGERRGFREKRRKYRVLCEEKRLEVMRWEKKIISVKMEVQEWTVVNRDRRRRRKVKESIEMEEWEEYFEKLLGGVKGKVRVGGDRRVWDRVEEDLTVNEIKRKVQRLREGNAADSDGIVNKMWKFGATKVSEWIWNLCSRVVVPMVKKRREGGES